jgi:hypothetical protein
VARGLLAGLFTSRERREETRRQRTEMEDEAILALHTHLGEVLADYMQRTNTNGVENAVYRLQRDVDQIEAARAAQKAKELLYAHLTPEQRSQYERGGFFRMNGQTNEYQIERGGRTYVKLNDKWRYLCIASTDGTMPTDDQTLATKLYIEGNEKDFLQIANLDGSSDRHVNVDGKVVDRKGRERTDLQELLETRAYYNPYLTPGIDGNLARRLNEIATIYWTNIYGTNEAGTTRPILEGTWEEDPLPF